MCSAPLPESSDANERSLDFEALAVNGAPECARCGAEDGNYTFDRTTKRLICSSCAQRLIFSNNDTAWQHLHLHHRNARERMLVGLGRVFHVVEMPEMRALVVACEQKLWYNANNLAEYLDQSTLQSRLRHFASQHATT